MKAEEIKYLDEVEHVLLRPDMYVGSIQIYEGNRWTIGVEGTLEFQSIPFCPAIIKLFDEVISNSIDESLKTDFKFSNIINVDIKDNWIHVHDNGRGLTSTVTDQGYSATLAFTKLRAGSNFNDSGRQSIGKFGVGVALTNMFSKEFIVDSVNTDKTRFFLNCKDHSKEIVKEKISGSSKGNGTTVSYLLDFEYFGMTEYDNIHVNMIYKRLLDLAILFPKITFKFNGKQLPVKSFKHYMEMLRRPFEWTQQLQDKGIVFAVTKKVSEGEKDISFANGVETFEGGTHLELIKENVISRIRPILNKIYKIDLKPGDIRDGLLIVLDMKNIVNMKFSSQLKEKLTYGEFLICSLVDIPDKFFTNIAKNKEIVGGLVDIFLAKQEYQLKEELKKKSKTVLKKKIPKLIDANSRKREECILFLTEGDSALGSLISVRDVNFHAGLPLRGKVLNVYDENDSKVIDNREIQDIMKAIGLKLHEKAPMDLRYGSIVFLTDADVDGNCISALLLNFFYKYWPELFERGIIKKYLSPIVIAKKGRDTKRFYSLDEYQNHQGKLEGYNIQYNKGLGGLDLEEYRIMLNEPRVENFQLTDVSGHSLKIAFGNDATLRKTWLKD